MQIPTREVILQAHKRIVPYVHRTPLLNCKSIDQQLEFNLWLKCYNFQKVGAYKARGATNKLLSLLSRNSKLKGVCTHSSGNHAAALAYISQTLKVPCHVVMPQNSPPVKKAAVLGYGATVIESGNTQKYREEKVEEVRKKHDLEFVHPYNDVEIIAGAATAALYLVYDSQEKIFDYVLFPVGGGGLASGTLLSLKLFAPETKRIGVEPFLARDAYLSIKEGKIHPQLPPITVADGLRTSLGDITFPIIRYSMHYLILVSEHYIIQATRLVWERMKILIEPSSATVVAAAKQMSGKLKGKKVGAIISGGNVELADFFDQLYKKYVKEENEKEHQAWLKSKM